MDGGRKSLHNRSNVMRPAARRSGRALYLQPYSSRAETVNWLVTGCFYGAPLLPGFRTAPGAEGARSPSVGGGKAFPRPFTFFLE